MSAATDAKWCRHRFIFRKGIHGPLVVSVEFRLIDTDSAQHAQHGIYLSQKRISQSKIDGYSSTRMA
jgi:hypothetical protein